MRKKSQWLIVNSQWFAFKSSKKLFLFLISIFLFLNLSAQSISASLDRDKILLGEQVTLQLNVTNVNSATSFVVSWPHIPDTLNHMEILKRTAIDTIEVNGTTSYQQNFTITGFDSGNWQLGPFDFLIQNRTTSKQTKLSSPAVYLTILPVDVSTMKDYHPIKDVIGVQTPFNWLPVIIVAAVILAAVIIFIIIKKRKKKVVIKPKVVLHGTPLERAIEKLQQLKDESLSSVSAIKKFHADIDSISREYFEEIMQIKIMQATLSELFSRMNVYMQDANLRAKMYEIFDLNAAVKFAKYLPSESESKNTLQEVISCLQKIDIAAQQARSNANTMVQKY